MRVRGALTACLVVSALALAGCGSGATHPGHRHSPGHLKPFRIVAAPAGLISSGPPQPDGIVWVLAGTRKSRTIDAVSLSTKTRRHIVAVSGDARAVTQSSTGLIALGLAAGRSGAVELLSGSTGSIEATVPVSDPVLRLAFGDDGSTLYVLEGSARVRAVAIVDTLKRKLVRTVALPSDAIGIAPTPDQKAIWSVGRSGVVQKTSLTGGRRPLTAFPLHGPAIAIALSPNGGTLYVLKGTRRTANIAVVSAATEAQKKALPAASNSVGLATSPDGSELYDPAGTATYGNIQIINL